MPATAGHNYPCPPTYVASAVDGTSVTVFVVFPTAEPASSTAPSAILPLRCLRSFDSESFGGEAKRTRNERNPWQRQSSVLKRVCHLRTQGALPGFQACIESIQLSWIHSFVSGLCFLIFHVLDLYTFCGYPLQGARTPCIMQSCIHTCIPARTDWGEEQGENFHLHPSSKHPVRFRFFFESWPGSGFSSGGVERS